jgi:general secretion pathway protein L
MCVAPRKDRIARKPAARRERKQAMIQQFLTWYGQQMADMLPRGLRPGRNGPADALVLDAELPEMIVFLERRRNLERVLSRWAFAEGSEAVRAALARAPRRLGAVVLRVPARHLLERETVLPLAAERDAGHVLRFEMDRLTPFSAEEVFWSTALLRRDVAAGTFLVRLSIVPRASILPLLATLAPLGLSPTLLEAKLSDGAIRNMPLDDGAEERGVDDGRRVSWLAYACAALALIALVLPFARQSIKLQAVDERIEALRPAVSLAEAMRRRLAADPSGLNVFAADRARSGDPLGTLATLTDILPDDTYLTGLSLRERHLAFEGRSQDSPRLIGLLAADPTIHNAAFSSPVTKAEDGSDMFSIRAEITP